MSNILKVLQEVKLREHKIDLGLIDDFNKQLGMLKQSQKTLMKVSQSFVNDLSAFGKLQNRLKGSKDITEQIQDEAEHDMKIITKTADKLIVQAKDLGVNPNSLKGMSELVKVVADVEDTIRVVNKNMPDAKKIISI